MSLTKPYTFLASVSKYRLCDGYIKNYYVIFFVSENVHIGKNEQL